MTHWMAITPRSGFFAKDGRGWFAGSSNRAYSHRWLRPTTIRGALCTATGRVVETAQAQANTRQEWLALKADLPLRALLAARSPALAERLTADHLMWSPPADALHTVDTPDQACRLTWWRPTCGMRDARDDAAAREVDVGVVNTKSKPTRGPTWWTQAQMIAWLRGDDSGSPGALGPSEPDGGPQVRVDVHVAIDPKTGTAEDSRLWAHDVMETLVRGADGAIERWSVVVALAPAPGRADAVSRVRHAVLAGDRRLAEVRHLDADEAGFATLPESLRQTVAARKPTALRLYAVTPAIFARGWSPDGFTPEKGQRGLFGEGPGGVGRLRLRGAIVPRPIPLTGWHMQRANPTTGHGVGPRDLTWGVAPGAVFGVEKPDNTPFTPDEVARLWLAQWGQRQDDGFGLLVPGLEPAP